MRAQRPSSRLGSVRVRLIRKIAQHVDGVDVSGYSVGEIFDLTAAEAALLVAEGWAIVDPIPTEGAAPAGDGETAEPPAAPAADGTGLTLACTLLRLRELRAEIQHRRRSTGYEHRRAEDVIREELRDSRARTIRAGIKN